MTLISRLQLWTQPLWLVLLVLPYLFVLLKNPEAFSDWTSFQGRDASGDFNLLAFCAACTVALSLVTQIGEQVDYLRFLPEKPRPTASAGGPPCSAPAPAGSCPAP